MPSTTPHLILISATAKPRRMSKDALCLCSAVGWVERSETHRFRRGCGSDGFCSLDHPHPALARRVRRLTETHKSGIAAQISATHSPMMLRLHELKISTTASPEASMSVKPRNSAWPVGPPPLPL